MDEFNPYRIKAADDGVPSGRQLAATGIVVHCSFVQTARHYLESIRRFRLQSQFRRVWWWFRLFVGILLGIMGLLALATGVELLALLLMPFAIALPLADKLDEWFLVMQFRQGSQHLVPAEVTIADAGYRVETRFEDHLVKWEAFSKAYQYADGFLLVRNGMVLYWLPFALLQNWNDQENLKQLFAHFLGERVERGYAKGAVLLPGEMVTDEAE